VKRYAALEDLSSDGFSNKNLVDNVIPLIKRFIFIADKYRIGQNASASGSILLPHFHLGERLMSFR
jgi:hypothetical protein